MAIYEFNRNGFVGLRIYVGVGSGALQYYINFRDDNRVPYDEWQIAILRGMAELKNNEFHNIRKQNALKHILTCDKRVKYKSSTVGIRGISISFERSKRNKGKGYSCVRLQTVFNGTKCNKTIKVTKSSYEAEVQKLFNVLCKYKHIPFTPSEKQEILNHIPPVDTFTDLLEEYRANGFNLHNSCLPQ